MSYDMLVTGLFIGFLFGFVVSVICHSLDKTDKFIMQYIKDRQKDDKEKK